MLVEGTVDIYFMNRTKLMNFTFDSMQIFLFTAGVI